MVIRFASVVHWSLKTMKFCDLHNLGFSTAMELKLHAIGEFF